MSDDGISADELVHQIRSAAGPLHYGKAYRSLTQRIGKSKLTLTESQRLIADEICDFATSLCIVQEAAIADAIEADARKYLQRYNRAVDRIVTGASYIDYVFPLCILHDTQSWYWWSRHISRYVPADFQFFRNDDAYHRVICRLIDMTPAQKAMFKAFFDTHDFKSGTRVAACQQILTSEQRDNWNRVKTAGSLPSEWNRISSDRKPPDVPADEPRATFVDLQITEESAFFARLFEQSEHLGINADQFEALSRLEKIVQHAYSCVQLRKSCPLSVRREDPVTWATHELMKCGEQICVKLILGDEQLAQLEFQRRAL